MHLIGRKIAMAVLFTATMIAVPAKSLELDRLRIANGGKEIFQDGHKIILRDNYGHFHRLFLRDGNLKADKLRDYTRTVAKLPDNALPDGVMSEGGVNISRAWLTDPTKRYDHGILGDKVEAGGLVVETITGAHLALKLPKSSVFEDRQARIWDVDGDDKDEVVVVRSDQKKGAALSVIGLQDNKLRIIAETPPIGTSHRWLNPVGAGDFDGDGNIEVAYVETPHIGGILTVFRLQDGQFSQIYRESGFSNHAMGSREQGLSTVLDVGEDGAVEMLIPDSRRRRLRLVSFKGGRFAELATVAIPGRIDSSFYPLSAMERVQAIVFLTSNGDLLVVKIDENY